MKTTVEMSDSLLTELKIIAAREHRRLRDVMEEIVALGLRAREQPIAGSAEARERTEIWLQEWQDLGRRIEEHSVAVLLADPR